MLTAVSINGTFQKAESLDVDMVLLGDACSDGSGADVCQKLRDNSRTQHIPVILLTHEDTPGLFLKGYRLGADDCLNKEIDKDELLGRMDILWRRSDKAQRIIRKNPQREVVREISKIIEYGLIEPYFQPIYFIKPFRLLGVEVLSRPLQGAFFSNTEEMFKAAFKHDMYYSLEALCWQKALEIVALSSRNEQLFFNCNPAILQNPKFRSMLDVFYRNQIPLNRVVLEITGHSVINQYDVFSRNVKQYRQMGFSLSVDDVGGGYASLKAISTTRPEIVKISSNIVRNVHLEPLKQSVITFLVDFCKTNKIVTVAERVETKEEMDILISLGVDAVQGYYLFRPTDKLNLRQMKDLCVDFP